jgi:hypothetical protein
LNQVSSDIGFRQVFAPRFERAWAVPNATAREGWHRELEFTAQYPTRKGRKADSLKIARVFLKRSAQNEIAKRRGEFHMNSNYHE